jgi:hypothetical protein
MIKVIITMTAALLILSMCGPLTVCGPLSMCGPAAADNGPAAERGGELAPLVSVETFARNDKVIPLAYDHGDYHCVHVKPPAILIRNVSGGEVKITGASVVGRSQGSEVARFTVHEARVEELMTADGKVFNKYLSNRDDPVMAYRLGRIYGEPALAEAGYQVGNQLPAGGYGALRLEKAFYFFHEGLARIDAMEVVVVAEQGGASSTTTLELPYTPYTCRGEYRFPIGGASMVASIPFGHSHRFANGQEFALDIFDIERNEDGSFSSSRVPSPMVIMGSDDASDYLIYGREVMAMAGGTVIEVYDRFPDEFAANPHEPADQRIARLKQHLIDKGEDPGNITSNFVLIDHGNGEYARYCHLRQEIPVKAGDVVEQGDVIGYVGNSGQSMEPHLHLELLDSADYLTANGLPIVFSNLNLARALESPSFGEKNSLVFSEFIFVFSD